MASKFGGIPLEENVLGSKFGGIPIDEQDAGQPSIKQEQVGPITTESTSAITGLPFSRQEMLTGSQGIESLGEMVSNVPESGFNFVKDIYTAVRHPVETAKGVGELSLGIIQKLIPGEQGSEKSADALGKALKERYGSIDNIKKTAVEDPVGFAADLSSILMAGGGILRATKIPSVSSIGTSIQQAGATVEPISAVKQAVFKPIARSIPESVPVGMYESSAKFGTTIPVEERSAMARTALEGGIMPTQKGVDRARSMINSLNDKISEMIDSATDQGKKIDTESVFKYLDDIKKETYLSDDPTRNLQSIKRIEKSMRLGFKNISEEGFTPKQAQQLKQRIYKAVNFANRPRSPQYAEVAKKSVARAAKEELENIYPQLKTLNSKEGALIKLLEAIERSASRISNRDIMGIGVPIKGTTGGVAAGAPGAAAGIIGGILDTPTVKARLAIALEKSRKAELKASRKGAASRLIAQQSGKVESSDEE